MNEDEHQYYPDPRPNQDELMTAFNFLVANNPEIFQPEEEPEDETPKSTIMSMPGIYQTAKKHVMSSKEDKKTSKMNMLENIAGIYENAEVKKEGLATLAKLDLPRYKKIKTTIKEFLQQPEKYLKSLKTDQFFPSVMNPETGKRYFELGLNQEQVFDFLKRLLKSGEVSEDYLLILSEYHSNCFSGNIIINPQMESNSPKSGSINIELVKGTHTGLAYGGSVPIIRSKSSWFSRFEPEVLLNEDLSVPLLKKLHVDSLQNSYIDFQRFKAACETKKATKKDKETLAYYQQLIEKVVEVLNSIPKDMDLFYNFSVSGEAFFPGYYEFILSEPVKDDASQKECEAPLEVLKWIKSMQIYFLDYRKADHYSDLQYHNLKAEESIA